MKLTWKSILIVSVVFLTLGVIFFIYTTTKSSPVTMELKMPNDAKGDAYTIQNSASTLTLILGKNDMVYGYFGNELKIGRSLELQDARKMILEGTEKFTKDSLIVLIKPGPDASYKNTVDILDEMTMNDIRRYQMLDLSKEEKDFLAKN